MRVTLPIEHASLEGLGHGGIVGAEAEVLPVLDEVWQLVCDVARHLVSAVAVVHREVGGLVAVVEDGVVVVLLRHPPALHRGGAHLDAGTFVRVGDSYVH